MWSLGSILVEVLSGFPLWLSLKSRVLSLDGHSIINYGLFGVAGRDNVKSLNKQNQLLGSGFNSLLLTLKKGFNFTDQIWANNKTFLDLMMQLLSLNPAQRISPDETIEHPFMQQM